MFLSPLYSMHHEFLQASKEQCPHSNFLKGTKWSPDGACLLTAADDRWFRIYDLPPDAMEAPIISDNLPPSGDSFPPALRIQEGETVYDMCWFPGMQASDPASCCFAATSRAHPIHLHDACSGLLRCTYRGYNEVDEVTAAFSLGFSPDGQRLLAGYQKSLLCFDVTRPGREYETVSTYVKRRRDCLPGMISCIAYSPLGDMVAAGSYSSSIAIYDPRTWEMLFLLQGHKGGLTQLIFTHDGSFLISGSRQDPHLLCWDLREGEAGELYRMERSSASTNQRVQFDIDPVLGRYLVSGGSDGHVLVFDLQTGLKVESIRVAEDMVNGCSFHPTVNLLATASGNRRYLGDELDGDEQVAVAAKQSKDQNCLKIWRTEIRSFEPAGAGIGP